MFKNKIIKFAAFLALAALIFNAGFFYGQNQIPFVGPIKIINQEVGQPKDLDFSLFWDAWRLVEQKYAGGKIDKEKMFYGAIHGMANSLGDPYTVFMDPAQTKEFASELEGSFEGIGAEIGIEDGLITIVAPLEDSPAQKAGLEPMDKVLKINGKSTAEMTVYDAVSEIRGAKGTVVALTIIRGREEQPREINVTRDTIIVKSVKLKFDAADSKKIAILEISQFGDSTFNDTLLAADQILKEDAKGIVLDLRNNPGGYFDKAVDIAGLFLPNGKIVTIKRSSEGDENYFSSGSAKLAKIPIVILANEGSASASEILAAALKDNQKIRIIGKKTFGKGLVQDVEKLKDGSSMKITIAEWLTPLGKNINKEGIAPDIEVELTAADHEAKKDLQLDKALRLIRE